MESKNLNNIFEELLETENKMREKRIYVNSLNQQIDKNRELLPQLNEQLKDVMNRIESNTGVLPNLMTNMTLNESERKCLSQQLEAFTHKKQDLMEKLECINEKLKNAIDMFFERTTDFNVHFGLKGEVYNQINQFHERIDSLKIKRDEMQSKIESMKSDIQCFETMRKEKKLALDAIRCLQIKKTKLKNENFELKDHKNKLLNEMKCLSDLPHTGSQYLRLKKELENTKVSDSSHVKSNSQKNIELENNFKINNQCFGTHTQRVFPIEPKKCEISAKNALKQLESNKNEVMFVEEVVNNSSFESKNPKEIYWEKYKKRRRFLLQNENKEKQTQLDI